MGLLLLIGLPVFGSVFVEAVAELLDALFCRRL